MIYLLLNSIALDPNRWTREKIAHYRFDQLLKPIANAGFHYIEIWEHHILRESESSVTNTKRIADSLDLHFPIIGMYPKLHLTGVDRLDELNQVKRIFNYAHIFGTKIVKIFVGNLSSEKITKRKYEYSLEFMSEMTNLAKSFGLLIAGETHQKTIFDTLESSIKFIKEVGATNFKICYQPYDLSDTNQALRDYKVLSEKVIHVHYQGRKNKKMELLEKSDIDYEALTKTVIESSFEGHISIEFVKDCVVKKSEDFDLQRVLANAQQDRDFIVRVGEKYGSQILY